MLLFSSKCRVQEAFLLTVANSSDRWVGADRLFDKPLGRVLGCRQ
jgi:hypothetical protein